MSNERLSIVEASKMLGLSVNTVRKALFEDSFRPRIARVRKVGQQTHFDIYKVMVLRYIGEIDESTD